MDKKKHKPHYSEDEESRNKKKNKNQDLPIDPEDLGFDEENEDLYLEIKRFIK